MVKQNTDYLRILLVINNKELLKGKYIKSDNCIYIKFDGEDAIYEITNQSYVLKTFKYSWDNPFDSYSYTKKSFNFSSIQRVKIEIYKRLVSKDYRFAYNLPNYLLYISKKNIFTFYILNTNIGYVDTHSVYTGGISNITSLHSYKFPPNETDDERENIDYTFLSNMILISNL